MCARLFYDFRTSLYIMVRYFRSLKFSTSHLIVSDWLDSLVVQATQGSSRPNVSKDYGFDCLQHTMPLRPSTPTFQ